MLNIIHVDKSMLYMHRDSSNNVSKRKVMTNNFKRYNSFNIYEKINFVLLRKSTNYFNMFMFQYLIFYSYSLSLKGNIQFQNYYIYNEINI